jgi:hypothetical protein
MVILIALGFISLFQLSVFLGWVSYLLLCVIPMEIVIGITWLGRHPAFAARRRQPVKGILLTLVALGVGAVVAPIYMLLAGDGISPPTPMLAQCTIVSVVVTFWITIMWGGWPFTKALQNPVTAGIVILAAAYGLNYALFRVFFNYEFMQDAPVYVASLDPHGMFNAWSALVFYVTALAIMFLMLQFDLWPLTKFRSAMDQPTLGVIWTIVALIGGGLAYYIGVIVIRMDPVAFLIRVPIPFIFGTIVVLNMLENSLFQNLAQPVKGFANTIAAAVIGTALAQMYSALAPWVSGNVSGGPPAYEFEIWLASALLSVTFPFMIFYAEFFRFWPLVRPKREIKP